MSQEIEPTLEALLAWMEEHKVNKVELSFQLFRLASIDHEVPEFKLVFHVEDGKYGDVCPMPPELCMKDGQARARLQAFMTTWRRLDATMRQACTESETEG